MQTQAQLCNVPGCAINSGGECLEGFRGSDVSKCPNYGAAPAPSSAAESAADTVREASKIFAASGQAMSISEANSVANSEPTRVILLAGPIKSGKTTCAVGIYESFRKGAFAGLTFAGSKTLLGFEQRCHLSRAASEMDDADTERTKGGIQEVLLHLRLLPPESDPLNLLICDMSGELFEAANESNEALRQVPLLTRADRLVLFLDGEKLLRNDVRHKVRQDAFTLLRACIQEGRLNERSVVDVVFSKQDLIRDSRDKDSVEKFQNEIEAEVLERFAQCLGPVTFHRVSARPQPDEGLTNLFASWATAPSITERAKHHPPLLSLPREIDRFVWKFNTKPQENVDG